MAPTILRPEIAHLIPICTSAVTLGLSLFQYPVFASFLAAKPCISGRPLSIYWDSFLYKCLGFIVAPPAASVFTAYFAQRDLSGMSAMRWYRLGAFAALGHFVFAPSVASRIAKIAAGREELGISEEALAKRNESLQKSWFLIHTIRTLTVDLAALTFFAKGFSEAFM